MYNGYERIIYSTHIFNNKRQLLINISAVTYSS